MLSHVSGSCRELVRIRHRYGVRILRIYSHIIFLPTDFSLSIRNIIKYPPTMTAKRKLSAISAESEPAVDPSDELMFLCLGGGNEVGRSCHILQYKGKTVMVCLLFTSETKW